VVDAETFRLYERTTVGMGGEFEQTTTHDVVELLPAAAAASTAARARLAPSARKAAKVVRRARRQPSRLSAVGTRRA